MKISEINSSMQKAADILIGLYPGEFTKQQLEDHIKIR